MTGTGPLLLASLRFTRGEISQLVDTRTKPYLAQIDAEARREGQRRRYKRNQIFGLMLVAAAILVWWLFHTNPGWIFPPGWWRL
jgi:hypothetical protein